MSRCLRALVLLALLVLCAKSATANVLSVDDYSNFQNLFDSRIRPLKHDLSALILRPPAGFATQAGLETQNCIIRLALSLDGFTADLTTVWREAGLAGKMTDSRDETFALAMLTIDARGFLANQENYRTMLNSTLSKCSQDGATVAKGQEILRIYSDAASLVQSIVKKIGAGLPQ